MNDISASRRLVEKRRGRIVERRIQRHLRLHARDAIHRQAVLALEILHHADQRDVELVAGG
jgi:hypothetical protein